jgi:hypothetical protein
VSSCKKKYHVSASVTISLHQTVWAKSRKDALRIAGELSMPSIHDSDQSMWLDEQDDQAENPDVWSTSGELDGVASEIDAEIDT